MNTLVPQGNALEPVIEKASAQLHVAAPAEIALAIALPLLAWLIANRLEAWFHRLPRTTWRARLADFVVPLLAPGFALLFIGIGLGVLKGMTIAPAILPFLIKVIIAWIAMRVVLLMSTREMAGWFIALVIIPITALHLLGLWEPIAALMQDLALSRQRAA